MILSVASMWTRAQDWAIRQGPRILSRIAVAFLAFSVGTQGAFADPPVVSPISQGEAQPQAQSVAIYLSFMTAEEDGKWEFRMAQSAVNLYRERIEKNFPGVPVKTVLVENLSEAQAELDSILKPGEEIINMYIDSHGSSGEMVSRDSDTLEELTFYGNSIGGKTSKNTLNIVTEKLQQGRLDFEASNRASLRFFQGIRGRFAKGAKVLLGACNLLKGPDETVIPKAEGIGRVLGLKDGSLYANNSIGRNYESKIIRAIPWAAGVAWTVMMIPVDVTVALTSRVSGETLAVHALMAVAFGPVIKAILSTATFLFRRDENKGYLVNFEDGSVKDLRPTTAKQANKESFHRELIELAPKNCETLFQ